jgi:hypothetical protein
LSLYIIKGLRKSYLFCAIACILEPVELEVGFSRRKSLIYCTFFPFNFYDEGLKCFAWLDLAGGAAHGISAATGDLWSVS